MAYEYINKFKDDFEDTTTIEMSNALTYSINGTDEKYQIRLKRVIDNNTDSLYFHMIDGGKFVFIEKFILRINDSENIPLQFIKRYPVPNNTGQYQYLFGIPTEKFLDICQANKIIFKITDSDTNNYIFGNTDNDMLLDYCRIFYTQVYDSNEFPNAILDCETKINNIATAITPDFKYLKTKSDGSISHLDKVRSACDLNGIFSQLLYDNVLAILDKHRCLGSSYGYVGMPKTIKPFSDITFILFAANASVEVEKEVSKDKGFIFDIYDKPEWSKTTIIFKYIVASRDKRVSFRLDASLEHFISTRNIGEHCIFINLYIFDYVLDGQPITGSFLNNNPDLLDNVEAFINDTTEIYKCKFKSLLQNIDYYEDLSRSLSDDSIYDGTLFDVLPSLNVRVGGQEKVEEELVPAQPQPTKQSIKQPTKQLNHDAATHQNHPKHHSEDEKKTKIWPIILLIIAVLLWLFF